MVWPVLGVMREMMKGKGSGFDTMRPSTTGYLSDSLFIWVMHWIMTLMAKGDQVFF
jgi:hypothetical protein